MGLIGKLTKRGATDDDDDDLDLEDEDGSIDPESDAGASKVGLLSRLRGLRKRQESNDEDDDDDDDDDDDAWDPQGLLEEKAKALGDSSGQRPDAETEEDEKPPDVQVVRMEGVQDVRVVGDPSGGPVPSGPQPGSAPPATSGQEAAGGGEGVPTEESSPAGGAASAGEPTENQDESKDEAKQTIGGSGLSLKDLFEEEVEVDEVLKDLAESMEDVPAQELADDLREFFEELEARMG